MYSCNDVRFPVVESWNAAVDLASRTLERRRDGLRFFARAALALAGLAIAAELAHHVLPSQLVANLAALLIIVWAGTTIALAIVVASTTAWRLRMRRVLRMQDEVELSVDARRVHRQSPDGARRILAS